MVTIRSFIFNILFILWTWLLCTSLIPLTWLGNKHASFAGRAWAWGTIRMLRFICGITHKVEGMENIPSGSCVIASKHQSAWDTMIFFSVLRHPTFIFKKELIKIPFFGKFLLRMGMIPVDRQGGASALKNMISEVKVSLDKGMALVLFPEGTRTAVGQNDVKYHPGVAAIYQDDSTNVPFVPVALNSGICWKKNSFLKYPGVITIKFMEPIKKGIDRKEFMKKLQADIERGCKEI